MAGDDIDDPLARRLGPVTVRELAALERQYREMAMPEALADPGMRLADEAKRAVQGIRDIARQYAPLTAADFQWTAADELRDLSARLAAPAFAGVDEALRAGEALRVSSATRLVRELQETLRDLSIGPFGETLDDLVEQANQMHATALREATQGALAQTLDTLLTAHGLSDWVDEITTTLRQPQWQQEVQQAAELFRSSDLLARLAEELYREPDWRELMDRAAAGELVAESTSHNGADLRQQANRAVRRTLPAPLWKNEIGTAVGIACFLVTIASSTLHHRANTAEHAQLRGDHQTLAWQSHRARVDRTWTLEAGRAIALHDRPLTHATDRTLLTGQARLVEVRRTDGWIELEAWDCTGHEFRGWLRVEDLDNLVPGDREICRPGDVAPVLITEAGPPAVEAWQAFFATEIDNDHTRQAYRRACQRFLEHCRTDGLSLADTTAAHVADWRDALSADKSASTVRQSLTALRRLFDVFVIRQVLPANPAQPVRPPRLTRPQTVTPSLRPAELIALFECFDPARLPDLRDRALMAVMAFSLARAGAVAALRVGDVDLTDPEPGIRLLEKRGHDHSLPLDPTVADWIRDYVAAAGIENAPDTPLFRSFGRGRGHDCVTRNGLSRQDIYALVRRRFEDAGLEVRGGCHVLRATGITSLLARGAPIDIVSRLAGHATIDMTRRYDRRSWAEMQQALRRPVAKRS